MIFSDVTQTCILECDEMHWFCLYVCLVSFFNFVLTLGILRGSGYPHNCYVAEAGFRFVMLLPPSPGC